MTLSLPGLPKSEVGYSPYWSINTDQDVMLICNGV